MMTGDPVGPGMAEGGLRSKIRTRDAFCVAMHANQLTVSPETVRNLVDEQFPAWRGLPIRGVASHGTVNALFRIGGKLLARFDCNRGGGTYEISDGKLAFGPLASTFMACPPDSRATVFMRDLQRAVSFFVQDGKLYLELPMDSGTMRFRAAP